MAFLFFFFFFFFNSFVLFLGIFMQISRHRQDPAAAKMGGASEMRLRVVRGIGGGLAGEEHRAVTD